MGEAIAIGRSPKRVARERGVPSEAWLYLLAHEVVTTRVSIGTRGCAVWSVGICAIAHRAKIGRLEHLAGAFISFPSALRRDPARPRPSVHVASTRHMTSISWDNPTHSSLEIERGVVQAAVGDRDGYWCFAVLGVERPLVLDRVAQVPVIECILCGPAT
jgi:hypothetical protein